MNSLTGACVDEEGNECPICMDPIHAIKNRTTTECGHCFHSSCLIKHSLIGTNIGCPLCRTELADIPEDDSFDGDTTTVYESDDEDSIQEPPLPTSQRRTITHVLAEMKRRNLTDRHLVSALISITFQQSWMDRYFMLNPAVDDKEEQVMDVLDNISLLVVDHRDTRRYADVLNNAPAVSEAGIGPNALLYNNL